MAEENPNAPTTPRLIAGAMSGTSADGVDVAITSITGRGLGMSATLVRHHHVPYDAATKQLIFDVRMAGEAKLGDLARLCREISLTYARTVNEALAAANLRATELAAIAAHGQTLYHDPPSSIQWFDPSLVAAEVGCAVVSDFRRADLAAGGQGAPLVPYADYLLFRHPTKNRVLLNIGGIANITYLKAGGSIDEVVAFDTGPGNCISDWLIREQNPTAVGFDIDGRGALTGNVSLGIVTKCMLQSYFDRPAPKSTDVPEMIALFKAAAGQDMESMSLQDLLATAAACVAASIDHALGFTLGLEHLRFEIVAAGGGVKNGAIMTGLSSVLGGRRIKDTSLLKVPWEAKEAIAFALLGAATLDGEPSNVPSVTGAKRRVVLGSMTPAPCPSTRDL